MSVASPHHHGVPKLNRASYVVQRLDAFSRTSDSNRAIAEQPPDRLTDPRFLEWLHRLGRQRADEWISAHLERVGVESTIDIAESFL
jgi:hypothetical protein